DRLRRADAARRARFARCPLPAGHLDRQRRAHPGLDERASRRTGRGRGQAGQRCRVRHRRDPVGRGVLLRRGAAHGWVLRQRLSAAGDRADAAWPRRCTRGPRLDPAGPGPGRRRACPPTTTREPTRCIPCTHPVLTTSLPSSPPIRGCWWTSTRTTAPAAPCWAWRWSASAAPPPRVARCCSRRGWKTSVRRSSVPWDCARRPPWCCTAMAANVNAWRGSSHRPRSRRRRPCISARRRMRDDRDHSPAEVTLMSELAEAEARPTEARLLNMVFPDHTNHLGTLFGGQALAWMDMASFIAASRYARTT